METKQKIVGAILVFISLSMLFSPTVKINNLEVATYSVSLVGLVMCLFLTLPDWIARQRKELAESSNYGTLVLVGKMSASALLCAAIWVGFWFLLNPPA
ncbi:MAG: hypothetical protein Q4A82_01570 [Corynebacterium sp.]|nr:hypothetical protein [Corynebacterium sp.]